MFIVRILVTLRQSFLSFFPSSPFSSLSQPPRLSLFTSLVSLLIPLSLSLTDTECVVYLESPSLNGMARPSLRKDFLLRNLTRHSVRPSLGRDVLLCVPLNGTNLLSPVVDPTPSGPSGPSLNQKPLYLPRPLSHPPPHSISYLLEFLRL